MSVLPFLPEQLSAELVAEAPGLFEGLVNNGLFGVYVIQNGQFIYVNQRMASLFGYRPEELSGKFGPLDLTAAEDRALAAKEIQRRLTGAALGSHYRFRGLRKDGSQFDVEVFGSLTRYGGQPAIAGLLLDATARRQAERDLQSQLGFIDQLLETIPSPVFYKDETGRYLGCNKAYEEFLGIARENFVGKTVFEIAPPELAEIYFKADQALFDAPGTQTYESSVSRKDGTRRDVVFYKATFRKDSGALGGLVGVILDITQQKASERTIWLQANYDELTGLPNRRLFLDRLEQEIKKAERANEGLTLLWVDLDRFKEVNDNLGHARGDELLQEAARRISECVREVDTVARLGGDEFTVILPGLLDPRRTEELAAQIIAALEKVFVCGGQSVYVTASVGITVCPDDGETTDQLLRNADQAMYRAKSLGRNRYCYFTASMQEAATTRLRLGNDLRNALQRGQLEVHFQPIIALNTGLVTKAEALLRWRHPQQGMVSPAQFIPMAEELGLIAEIGNWVFEQAIQMALTVRERFHTDMPLQISVNKSPRQFVADKGTGEWVTRLKSLGLPAEAIQVEITEGLLLDERPEVKARLLQFRDEGIQISLDDFGTGYSAMSYLKRFDIDYLKIDQSFVRDLTDDASDRAICEAIIAMGHKLGLGIIAEGIETAAQRDLLIQAGCDFGQGYLFARPLPAAAFLGFVTDNLAAHRSPPSAA